MGSSVDIKYFLETKTSRFFFGGGGGDALSACSFLKNIDTCMHAVYMNRNLDSTNHLYVFGFARRGVWGGGGGRGGENIGNDFMDGPILLLQVYALISKLLSCVSLSSDL